MKFIKQAISQIAPHRCLGCGVEGVLACGECLDAGISPRPPTCYKCNRLTHNFKTCTVCYRPTRPKQVLVASEYDGLLKELIGRFKYGRAIDAFSILVDLVVLRLSGVELEYDLVTSVPSSPKRYRKRGFNPADLMARELAERTGVEYARLLARVDNSRQVGTDRNTRLQQIRGKITMKPGTKAIGRKVLLVDDVLTTGATLDECSKVLREHGAKRVVAAVVARH